MPRKVPAGLVTGEDRPALMLAKPGMEEAVCAQRAALHAAHAAVEDETHAVRESRSLLANQDHVVSQSRGTSATTGQRRSRSSAEINTT